MRHVADIKLTPPSTTNPLLPWFALGAAVGLIAILLAASNRYLTRFQKPYSFKRKMPIAIYGSNHFLKRIIRTLLTQLGITVCIHMLRGLCVS